MKTFHCDHCQQLVFFENIHCVKCGHELAFLPDLAEIASLEPDGGGAWRSPAPGAEGRAYRLCENYHGANVCNWAVPAETPEKFCNSCRLTRVIPDLGVPGNREKWYRLEVAKRRLVYTLVRMDLPLATKTADPQHGLAFEFLADPPAPGAAPVLTGHANGVITINIAEADDAERERRRTAMHEPYRTLLGHFRHEIGHYYWDRLVRDRPAIVGFRKCFGDERADYGRALERHYKQGEPADWQERFVSAYAASHPWEDWAETWAHYLHMSDTLETATASGLSLRPPRPDEPEFKPGVVARAERLDKFDQLLENWFALMYVLNNLNRGMGLADAYPFVLSPPAIAKLRFVHELIAAHGV